MSRRQRLHVPGGTYYVVQRNGSRQPIFSRPDDYALFERLLALTLRRAGACVHAYCWTANAIHLALQIDAVSVGRVMQGLTSRYARSVHQQAGESGHFFRQRYEAVLIDPEEYLLKLIHHIHQIPAVTGPMEGNGAYAFSSLGTYLGMANAQWLTTRTVLRLLAGGEPGARVDFKPRVPALQDTQLFEHGSMNNLRVIGSPEFLARLPRHLRTYRTRTSLDQIIHTVTCRLGVDREHVLSSSRQRELTLARALIAWYASERGVATLSEVARRLRRDPSTLSAAVTRYRLSRPELFKLSTLHDVVPLGPLTGGTPTRNWDSNAAEREDAQSL